MTDAMIRQVMADLSAELREQRERAQAIVHDVGVVGGTCLRIEERLTALAQRLEDLRDDHDRVCADIAQTDRSIVKRISSIESQAAWVRAWAAGAAAVVVAGFGVVTWLVGR